MTSRPHPVPRALVALTLSFGFGSIALADTLEVPGDHATISDAVAAASDNDTILVGPGVYMETVVVDKPLTVLATDGPAATIIDANGTARPMFVAAAADGSLIEGFTLTGGVIPNWGGGLRINAHAVEVRNCVITGNTADLGGGIGLANNADALITQCVILGNSAMSSGGGLRMGGNSTATVVNCVFNGNEAPLGGAVFVAGTAVLDIMNCTLRHNITSGFAACGPDAGACDDENGSPGCDDADCCVAVCAVDPFCCDNSWDGICVDEAAELCTGPVRGAIRVQGMAAITITNTVLRRGLAAAVPMPLITALDDGAVTVTYSNVSGGWPGTGNVTTVAPFVDPEGPDGIHGNADDDLRLNPGNGSVDSGDTLAWLALGVLDADLDGVPRLANMPTANDNGIPVGGLYIDMGAYENQPTPPDPKPNPCPTDLNGDGVTDAADLAALLSSWGVCP